MSYDWNDRDLIEWAKKTLPEFMHKACLDPMDKEKIYAKTPWQGYEITIDECQIEGEVGLTGKKGKDYFAFDLDLGMRLRIQKGIGTDENGEELANVWLGVVNCLHFENQNLQPECLIRLEKCEEDVKHEVEWYFKEGMGKRFVWHALARWNAYAVRKWMKVDPGPIEEPYNNADPPPTFPPFKEEERKAYEEKIKAQIIASAEPSDEELKRMAEAAQVQDLTNGEKLMARGLAKDVHRSNKDVVAATPDNKVALKTIDPVTGEPFFKVEEQVWKSPPVSDDEDEEFDPNAEYELDENTMEIKKKGAPPKMKKFKRYPFLPSMLAGVGGPSGFDWLRPKDCAIAHPELLNGGVKTRQPGCITQLDVLLNKAEKKKERYEKLADGNSSSLRTLELQEAIEKKDFMRAFGRMDAKTTNIPHPETGRYALHCCVGTKQKELLEMVIAAKADLNTQDNFGQTALMLAAQQGSKDLCQVLLDAGADPVAEDALGRSAADRVKTLPLEEENPFDHWREKMNGEPIPEDPAKASHELKSLISDKEKPKKQGMLLLRAITQKDYRTASSAVDAKADLTLTDEAGNTALLLLAKSIWPKQEGIQMRLAEKIIKAGGDVNVRNSQGNTALLYAAYRGNEQMIDGLLRLNADVSCKNHEENTALMYAAHGGHEMICTALLDAFAKPAEKNKFGLNAEKMALKRGFRNCAVLVQAYELAPKKPGEDNAPRKKDKENKLSFDYSRWNELEKEMEKDEKQEENIRRQEAYKATQKPPPNVEDTSPEMYGLPPDTPWPPKDPNEGKDSFDYSRWDKIVDEIEKNDFVKERFEHLQANPQYEWKNGSKMQVIF